MSDNFERILREQEPSKEWIDRVQAELCCTMNYANWITRTVLAAARDAQPDEESK